MVEFKEGKMVITVTTVDEPEFYCQNALNAFCQIIKMHDHTFGSDAQRYHDYLLDLMQAMLVKDMA